MSNDTPRHDARQGRQTVAHPRYHALSAPAQGAYRACTVAADAHGRLYDRDVADEAAAWGAAALCELIDAELLALDALGTWFCVVPPSALDQSLVFAAALETDARAIHLRRERWRADTLAALIRLARAA